MAALQLRKFLCGNPATIKPVFMGMDAVEIVMLTEERFGIAIDNADAEKVTTPGMLIDLVMQLVQRSGPRVCRTQRAFYFTRRFLMSELGLERDQIGLAVNFRKWLPPEKEATFWRAFHSRIGATKPPEFALTGRQRRQAYVVFFATGVAAWALARQTFASGGALIAFLTTFLLFAAVAIDKRFNQYATRIPARFQTIRDLSELAASSMDEGQWLRSEVAAGVKKIVQDVLGVDDSAYREDADFVKELGLA